MTINFDDYYCLTLPIVCQLIISFHQYPILTNTSSPVFKPPYCLSAMIAFNSVIGDLIND